MNLVDFTISYEFLWFNIENTIDICYFKTILKAHVPFEIRKVIHKVKDMLYILTHCNKNANYMLHKYLFFMVETKFFYLPFIVLYIYFIPSSTFFYILKKSKILNEKINQLSPCPHIFSE